MVEGSDTNLHGHVPKLNVNYAERMWRNAAPKNAGGPGEVSDGTEGGTSVQRSAFVIQSSSR